MIWKLVGRYLVNIKLADYLLQDPPLPEVVRKKGQLIWNKLIELAGKPGDLPTSNIFEQIWQGWGVGEQFPDFCLEFYTSHFPVLFFILG